jgi:hypothetical protein
MFTIEDERHDERQEGEFATFASAVAALRRLAQLPWDRPPNLAPCTSWKTCGRKYVVVEYESLTQALKEINRTDTLEVGRDGPRWLIDVGASDTLDGV